ncbi:hypothetical protein ACF073_18845 [Streptomyces sp. NPDC015171]|uniref:hypothetical protein n=1 Tax=Streptomyces sp. NPDC015171 TaxID=3364945 RepID=UPI0036FA32E6
MSTEARQAPIPPRPSAPPAHQPPGPRPAPAPRTADDTRLADCAPDEEPSVFTPRGPRSPAARVHGPRPSAVPEVAEPVSPPPPPASARFPDAPPGTASAGSAGRPGARSGRAPAPAKTVAGTGSAAPGTVAGPGSPTGAGPAPGTAPGTAARTSPRVRPGGEPGGRPGAPADIPSETTARLRPAREPRRPGVPPEAPSETTARLRPIPAPPPGPAPSPSSPSVADGESRRPPGSAGSAGTGARAWGPTAPARPASPAPTAPDPAHSWSAAPAGRPVVSFAEPEAFGERTRLRPAPRTAAAAACLVLGFGLLSGAATGSWLTGDGPDSTAATAFSTAGTLWHSVPVDDLFPPTVQGTGAGPGGADRTWTRIAVAPDAGCARAFDPLLSKALAPVGCRRLLRATYTDATQSYVTTVGLLFTKADPAAMSALAARFRDEHLDRRADLMPRAYAAAGTPAAGFGERQRASWTVSVLTDAPVVAFAVSGWADGRTVDAPQPAADAVRSGATAAPAQAGLGNEAQGLADRVERRLRKTVGTATEKPS